MMKSFLHSLLYQYETEKDEEAADGEEGGDNQATPAASDDGIGPRGSVMIAEGDPRRDRAYRVALELLNTERTYVDVLHLLDQVLETFVTLL